MSWRIDTIEPEEVGLNYIAVVHKPAKFTALGRPLEAIKKTSREYHLPYSDDDTDAPATEDYWDTGIKFTNGRTREVVIKAMHGRSAKGKDEPTVADGAGGGGGRKPKLIKVCKVGTFYRLA